MYFKFGWNMLDGEKVYVQNLLGEPYYWNSKTGWIKLDKETIKKLIPYKEEKEDAIS
jgi:hypothetical protein